MISGSSGNVCKANADGFIYNGMAVTRGSTLGSKTEGTFEDSSRAVYG